MGAGVLGSDDLGYPASYGAIGMSHRTIVNAQIAILALQVALFVVGTVLYYGARG